MYNQTVAHPNNEILFSTKTKWTTKSGKDMKEIQNYILLNERNQSEKTTLLHSSNYAASKKRLDSGHSNLTAIKAWKPRK